MKEFIERLLKEHEELTLKIYKLTIFVGTEKFFKLSLIEQDMVKNQLFYMMKYEKILKRRIKFYRDRNENNENNS